MIYKHLVSADLCAQCSFYCIGETSLVFLWLIVCKWWSGNSLVSSFPFTGIMLSTWTKIITGGTYLISVGYCLFWIQICLVHLLLWNVLFSSYCVILVWNGISINAKGKSTGLIPFRLSFQGGVMTKAIWVPSQCGMQIQAYRLVMLSGKLNRNLITHQQIVLAIKFS
jgi:hypothetical protein